MTNKTNTIDWDNIDWEILMRQHEQGTDLVIAVY